MYVQQRQGKPHLVKQTQRDVEIARATKLALSRLEEAPCPTTMRAASKELRKLYCLLYTGTTDDCEMALS